jgi:hypothetical protein
MKAAHVAFACAASLVIAQGSAAAEPGGPALPALVLGVDGGVMHRTLAWNDDLFGMLRPYSLAAAPILGGEIEVYPGAFVTRARPAWLGLVARGEGIVGVSTQRVGHTDALPTHAWAFTASVRGRLPFSRGAAWLDAGAAGRAFTIAAAGITTPDFPSVSYLGPRLAVGGEVLLPAGFVLSAGAGAARWVGTGDLGSAAWFPHVQAWGADLHLRLAWQASFGLGPYLDLAWSRDLAALRPQPGEANVAGGLADDRLAARLGLSWTFRRAPNRDASPSGD